ncbi:DUF664 domain-containing protein [Streptomyces sp. NPDC058297]|uniref:mycothiol transferase n=1 Tax=unclassified Streptomyces TaxID=2593676 RepID=UPI0036E97843
MAGGARCSDRRGPRPIPRGDRPRRHHHRDRCGHSLAWWPHHLFGEPHLHTLRDILLHVITETACHAGQLDAARELLDGRRRMVLT